MVLGFLFNGFILTSFIQLPTIRNLTNYLVVSLEFIDMLIVLSSPLLLLLIFLKKIDFEFGNSLRVCCEIFCGMASMMNFACISVDRMIAISKPLYHLTLPPLRSLRIIALIWLLAFTAALLNGFFSGLTNNIYVYVLFSIAFVIPTICTIVSYSIIAKALLCSSSNSLRRHHQQDCRTRQTIRLTWKILLVILPGLTMWGCFWTILIIAWNTDKITNLSGDIVEVLNLVPILVAVINPLIYILMTADFRKNFVRLLCRRNRTVTATSNTMSPRF